MTVINPPPPRPQFITTLCPITLLDKWISMVLVLKIVHDK